MSATSALSPQHRPQPLAQIPRQPPLIKVRQHVLSAHLVELELSRALLRREISDVRRHRLESARLNRTRQGKRPDHLSPARKAFEHAIRADHEYADAYNNLGVVFYEARKYGAAVKQYQKAIAKDSSSASFFSNLGAAHFSKREFEPAVAAYQHALELDPEVFERTSRAGVRSIPGSTAGAFRRRKCAPCPLPLDAPPPPRQCPLLQPTCRKP